MAVLMEQIMPEQVGLEILDEVAAVMDVENDPPAGLVVHVHFLENGRCRIVDVWESAEHYESFARDRLTPAMQQVVGQRGLSMAGPPPETSFTEVASIIRG